jgi:hypothetical protein
MKWRSFVLGFLAVVLLLTLGTSHVLAGRWQRARLAQCYVSSANWNDKGNAFDYVLEYQYPGNSSAEYRIVTNRAGRTFTRSRQSNGIKIWRDVDNIVHVQITAGYYARGGTSPLGLTKAADYPERDARVFARECWIEYWSR